MAAPGREGIIEAAEGSGLLVLGLSERWRQEGLGTTRSEIAKKRARSHAVRAPRPAPGALSRRAAT